MVVVQSNVEVKEVENGLQVGGFTPAGYVQGIISRYCPLGYLSGTDFECFKQKTLTVPQVAN